MENNLCFDRHPSEEVFEEYCFDRLPEAETAALEEHLLACPVCAATLQTLDEFIVLMKAATAEYKQSAKASSRLLQFPGKARPNWKRPGLFSLKTSGACAAGVVLVCSMAVLLLRSGPPRLAAAVPLSAFRGGVASGMTDAPAGRPLNLNVDVTDLPTADRFRLEVVGARGQGVWSGDLPQARNQVSGYLPKGLPAGAYWVRLYSSSGDLLREFGLGIR